MTMPSVGYERGILDGRQSGRRYFTFTPSIDPTKSGANVGQTLAEGAFDGERYRTVGTGRSLRDRHAFLSSLCMRGSIDRENTPTA